MVNGNSMFNDIIKIFFFVYFCYNKLIYWLLELNLWFIDIYIIRIDYRVDWVNCKRFKYRVIVVSVIKVFWIIGVEVGVGWWGWG